MKFSNTNFQTALHATNFEQQTREQEVNYQVKGKQTLEKIKIQIEFTYDHQIVYSEKDTILRIIQVENVLDNPEIYNNMDQIQNLSWQTQYDQNNKKNGKCITFWNKDILENIGGYFKDGLKQGLWKEPFPNFWKQIILSQPIKSLAQVFEAGEYHNDLRIGIWNYYHQQQEIGGLYNKNGQKQGKWLDLDEGFYIYKEITYYGEYNTTGMKVGIWDIMYNNSINGKKYKQIGGGLYDYLGNQKKIGKWIELDEGFYKQYQVIHKGEYDMNGMKKGRWDIMYRKWNQEEFKLIGGGSYDQVGNQKKIGMWVELHQEFGDFKKILLNGQYNMNGRKIGKWDTYWVKRKQINEYVGGGSYDQEGQEKKIGKWVELDKEFYKQKFVTLKGEYNVNGIKVGRWDIMYRRYYEQKYKQIGGGSYDSEGIQKKIGKWIELDEGFNLEKQVIYNGEYNINGIKVGRWDTMFSRQVAMLNKLNDKDYEQIGGGSYDQEGQQIKIGRWVELDEGFKWDKQFTQNGQYKMNGRKVGVWVEMNIKDNCKRGEKKY